MRRGPPPRKSFRPYRLSPLPARAAIQLTWSRLHRSPLRVSSSVMKARRLRLPLRLREMRGNAHARTQKITPGKLTLRLQVCFGRARLLSPERIRRFHLLADIAHLRIDREDLRLVIGDAVENQLVERAQSLGSEGASHRFIIRRTSIERCE